jgi:hypothetical protein
MIYGTDPKATSTAKIIKGTSYSGRPYSTNRNDVFGFSSSRAAHDNRIVSVQSGDKLDVSLNDADVYVSGNQAFRRLATKISPQIAMKSCLCSITRMT